MAGGASLHARPPARAATPTVRARLMAADSPLRGRVRARRLAALGSLEDRDAAAGPQVRDADAGQEAGLRGDHRSLTLALGIGAQRRDLQRRPRRAAAAAAVSRARTSSSAVLDHGRRPRIVRRRHGLAARLHRLAPRQPSFMRDGGNQRRRVRADRRRARRTGDRRQRHRRVLHRARVSRRSTAARSARRRCDRRARTSVVLGHALWTRRFGGDPQAVGRTITIDADEYRDRRRHAARVRLSAAVGDLAAAALHRATNWRRSAARIIWT